MSHLPPHPHPAAAVEQWLARRPFRASDFPARVLAEWKAAQALTVSVVLPARNEQATVAGVVRAVMGLAGTLVDEVVVIDDGSYDATAGVAAAAGATVHRSRDLMPEYGLTAGKGDVLWRSLAATSGDIVAFVDADIENPDPRFVAGLLGPLLAHPTVQLVKGFYDRPLRLHDALVPGGGGRVTELMARPMLNLLWPELAGVVQPLAGEYAARRAHLESVPFFTGYGVELGLLVDTLAAHGADSVAQVDLGERVHRNQPVDALSRMAFAIAQVVLQRQGADPTTSRYVQFARDEHHRIVHSVTDVRVVERPPMRPRCQPSRPASRSPDERGTVPGQGIYLATGRTA